MSRKSGMLCLVALLVVFVAVMPAMADTYDFSITGGGINASGILSVSPVGSGVYQITGISGNFSDSNGNYSGQITGLYPDPSYSPIITTSYLFSLDNLFYPAGAPANSFWGADSVDGQFDVAGMVFNVAGGYEVGIWGQGTAAYGLNSQLAGNYLDNGNSGVPVSFTATASSPVPEPASLALFGSGLLGLAGFARRRFLNR